MGVMFLKIMKTRDVFSSSEVVFFVKVLTLRDEISQPGAIEIEIILPTPTKMVSDPYKLILNRF